ncbi:uncharacterized protein LOC125659134 [Ostrea edulis]|uniref:uncharacterized protein LOC125659134 n=1 Tax=Ostrea edulis TaxID=37623 RepID=UPI0024AEF5FA|nr:uncharacterized protein LOC125659134 [Ostrea edulis]
MRDIDICNKYYTITMVTVSLTMLMTSFFHGSYSLPIESCPMFGCRPSGTFSYDLDIRSNVSMAWPKPFKQSSFPDSLGCVGNEELIVCQGDGQTNRGYVSLNVENGSLAWSDRVLHHPTLPIMDIYGDIVGTDGSKLVKYEVDGTLEKPVINDNVSPVYSITFSDNNILAIVSKRGSLVTVESNGIPHAYMEFRGWEERMNGTFIPIAPPVVAGHRIYILTAFRPDQEKKELSMQRLYAVDIFNVLSGKLKIAWYFNFERLAKAKSNKRTGDKAISVQPQILINTDTNTLFVNLPPVQSTGEATHVVWGFKDDLKSSAPTLLFKTPQPVSELALYESSKSVPVNNRTDFLHNPWQHFQGVFGPRLSTDPDKATLWAVSTEKELILKLSPLDGSVLQLIRLNILFNMTTTVTSRLMVARTKSSPEDVLIFGIEVTPTRNGVVSEAFIDICRSHSVNPNLKYYVVCLRDAIVNWIIDTPSECPVVGQITGIKTSDNNKPDMLVVTTNSPDKSEIFALNV